MSDPHPSLPAHFADADYQAAQRFLHVGDWARAQVLLEILDQRYPDVKAIAQALVLTQLKADMDAGAPVRARRWAFDRRRWTRRAALLVALALLVWAGVAGFATQITPRWTAWTQQRAEAALAAELEAGNALVAAGQFDAAEAYFRERLAQHPGSPALQAALAGVEEARQLHALYDQAVEAEAQGDLATALDLLRAITARQAGYADAARRLARIERHHAIDALIEDARELLALELNDLVVARLEEARTLELAYRRDEVAQLLTTAYFDLAQAILRADPPQPERLPVALGYLDQVLNLDTAHAAATEERRLVRLYLEGAEFAAQANYPLAVTRWQTLYDERPAYLAGGLANALYDIILLQGDRLRETGDCSAALDQYNQALALPILDSTQALARIVEMQACLAPTVVPLPEPTPIPDPN